MAILSPLVQPVKLGRFLFVALQKFNEAGKKFDLKHHQVKKISVTTKPVLSSLLVLLLVSCVNSMHFLPVNDI